MPCYPEEFQLAGRWETNATSALWRTDEVMVSFDALRGSEWKLPESGSAEVLALSETSESFSGPAYVAYCLHETTAIRFS